MFKRLLLILPLLLMLAACNRDNVDVQRNGDGTATITVTLNEAEVNTMIETALNRADDPLLRDPGVDLQNGQMVITGEYDRQDGGGSVSGSLTLTASIDNGRLQLEVTSINIEGFDVTDERIAEFNESLAVLMSNRARQDNPRATLTSVSITEDTFSFSLVVNTQR